MSSYDRAVNYAWDQVAREAGLPQNVSNLIRQYAGPMTERKVRRGAAGMKRLAKRASDVARRTFGNRSRSMSNVSQGSGRSGGQAMSIATATSAGRVSGSKRSTAKHKSERNQVTILKTKRKRGKSNGKSLRKRIAALERFKPKMARREYRNMDSFSLTVGANVCAYGQYDGVDAGTFESAIQDLPFLDRGATVAMDSIDFRTSTFNQMKIDIRNIYSKITVRNNYRIPVEVHLYCLRSKQSDNSTNITDFFIQEDAQLSITDGDTNIMAFPTDFKNFRDQFKIVKHAKSTLQAGDELVMDESRKTWKYSPTDYDNEASPANYKGDYAWLVRINGVVAHDATNDALTGIGDGQVDIVTYRKFTVVYDGDAPFKSVKIVNSLTAMPAPETGGPAVGGDHAD